MVIRWYRCCVSRNRAMLRSHDAHRSAVHSLVSRTDTSGPCGAGREESLQRNKPVLSLLNRRPVATAAQHRGDEDLRSCDADVPWERRRFFETYRAGRISDR